MQRVGAISQQTRWRGSPTRRGCWWHGGGRSAGCSASVTTLHPASGEATVGSPLLDSNTRRHPNRPDPRRCRWSHLRSQPAQLSAAGSGAAAGRWGGLGCRARGKEPPLSLRSAPVRIASHPPSPSRAQPDPISHHPVPSHLIGSHLAAVSHFVSLSTVPAPPPLPFAGT